LKPLFTPTRGTAWTAVFVVVWAEDYVDLSSLPLYRLRLACRRYAKRSSELCTSCECVYM